MPMLDALVVTAALTAAPPDPAPVPSIDVRARIVETDLPPGASGTIELTLTVPRGWSASDAGIPKPILQIEVPPGVTLDGKVLTDHRELAKNEFLQAPYERLVDVGTSTISFRVTGDVAPDATLGLNVVAYLAPVAETKDPTRSVFIRRRLELPVAGGATAVEGNARNTRWGDGTNPAGLAVGDTVPAVILPQADGTTVDLQAMLAERDVVVTTYRAFW